MCHENNLLVYIIVKLKILNSWSVFCLEKDNTERKTVNHIIVRLVN